MIDEIEPSWKVDSAFINEHLGRALQLDALRSSHPIEMPCPDEDTIQQIFDAISYSKGGSVLRMLANMVGKQTFLKGVSIYLKKHLYGNARTKDLWDGIAEASGKDIAPMMFNWTNKVGFPVIRVEETEEGLKLTQNRFFATADPSPEEDETIWHVPLELLAVKSGKAEIDHDAVLKDREATIPLKDVKNVTYKLNAETCGVCKSSCGTRLVALDDHSFVVTLLLSYVQIARCILTSDWLSSVMKLASRIPHSLSVIAWDLSKMRPSWPRVDIPRRVAH